MQVNITWRKLAFVAIAIAVLSIVEYSSATTTPPPHPSVAQWRLGGATAQVNYVSYPHWLAFQIIMTDTWAASDASGWMAGGENDAVGSYVSIWSNGGSHGGKWYDANGVFEGPIIMLYAPGTTTVIAYLRDDGDGLHDHQFQVWTAAGVQVHILLWY